MSDHGHGHGHGADHVPHVSPIKVYLATWGGLVVLTAITVAVSYVNFGPANLVIALTIATIKAAVVAALFMHLWHDHKFHSLILVSGGLFLLIFVAFTMFDTEYRGRADSVEGERPADITRPFEGTRAQAALKAKYASAAPGSVTSPVTHAGGSHEGPMASATGHGESVSPPAGTGAHPAVSASVPPADTAPPIASASVEPAPSASMAPPVASVPPPASASAAPSASANGKAPKKAH